MKNKYRSNHKVLKKILPQNEREFLIGDFDEEYDEMKKDRGVVVALIWYWIQILKALPLFINDSLYRSTIMFKNYLKITMRNLSRHKIYSSINISGLAVGMAACILILLYIQDELSYDRHHEMADRIYRTVFDWDIGNGVISPDATNPPALGPALKRDFPEIRDYVRLMPPWGGEVLVKYEDKQFFEKSFMFADSTFFTIFSFPLIEGDPRSVLQKPNSIVVSRNMAKRYFGDEDPIGKSLDLEFYSRRYRLEVSGIMENIPDNSHFKTDFVAPKAFRARNVDQNWGWWNWYTYVLFEENADRAAFLDKFPAFADQNYGFLNAATKFTDQRTLKLQPIKDIHLTSELKWELEPNGSITYVYIFGAIALLILSIACINFMNLSTARSANRTREVGLRKVVGAKRMQLIKQFMGESLFLSVLSAAIAVVIVKLALPAFNELAGKNLNFSIMEYSANLLWLVSVALIAGLVSGIYPALFLSGFRPTKILQGDISAAGKGSNLRRVLVVSQFAISIFLIIGTSIIAKQLDFVSTKDLGFDKEQMVVMPMKGSINRDYPTLRDKFENLSGVLGVAATGGTPGGLNWTSSFRAQGSQEDILINNYPVDANFIANLKIEVLEGRSYSTEFMADTSNTIILNESAVKAFGLESPAAGKQIYSRNTPYTVVGVVKDFHFQSLRRKIEPFGFLFRPNGTSNIVVKVNETNIEETLALLENEWHSLGHNYPFEYSFMDDDFMEAHEAELKLGSVFDIFTLLAIFVACLGLFGLASFTAEKRTKEIGIRKTLGASISNISLLLSKEFTIWVFAANIVAWPLAYYGLNKWLQGFAYRADIGYVPFIQSALIAFTIALLTVSYQSIKAAMANPVNSLRSE